MTQYDIYMKYSNGRFALNPSIEAPSLTSARKYAMHDLVNDSFYQRNNVRRLAVFKAEGQDYRRGGRGEYVGTVIVSHRSFSPYFSWEDKNGKVSSIDRDGKLV